MKTVKMLGNSVLNTILLQTQEKMPRVQQPDKIKKRSKIQLKLEKNKTKDVNSVISLDLALRTKAKGIFGTFRKKRIHVPTY